MMAESTDSNAIRIDRREGGITVLSLDRPPANALNTAVLQTLDRMLDGLVAEEDTRALVLTGAGKVMSAGMDLKELQDFDAGQERAMVEWLNRSFTTLYGLPFPVIAAVNGHAIAGGLFFLLCSDYRVASESAGFGLAEVRVGVRFPVGPLEIARAELAPHALRRLMLGGRNLPAETAVRLGVVDELAPAESVMDRALAAARDYADIPPHTFAAVKAQLRGETLRRIRVAVQRKEDPMLDGWFSEETREAARTQLAAVKQKSQT
jgi:enoyl-CoA hydratase/carnithine racemase